MIRNSLILLSLIIFSCQTTRSQTNNFTQTLSDEEYEVINDLLGDENIEVTLYSEIDFSKTWSYLMHPKHLDALYGPPCNDGKKIIEWENIFSKEDFNKIRDEIIKLRPYKLDKSKLSKNIILINDYSKSREDQSSTRIITKPIILNDWAIIKQSDLLSELIIIATKSSGKWQPICMKWVVMTIED